MVVFGLRELLPQFATLEEYVSSILTFAEECGFVDFGLSSSTLSRLLRGTTSLNSNKLAVLKAYLHSRVDASTYIGDFIERTEQPNLDSPLELLYNFLHTPSAVSFFVFLVEPLLPSSLDYIFTLQETLPIAFELSKWTGAPYLELNPRLPTFDDQQKGMTKKKFHELPYRISGERVGSYWVYKAELGRVTTHSPHSLFLVDYVRQGYILDVLANLLQEVGGKGTFFVLTSVGEGRENMEEGRLAGEDYQIFHEFKK